MGKPIVEINTWIGTLPIPEDCFGAAVVQGVERKEMHIEGKRPIDELGAIYVLGSPIGEISVRPNERSEREV